jgi:predicted ATP-grasp superfamily ATP-dependent carboligase
MAHVLIGFAEALPAPEVFFSLSSGGHEVSAFARDVRLPLTALPLKHVFALPDVGTNSKGAIDALRRIMERADAPDIILPLDDLGLWLVDAALSTDPRIAGATGACARAALDKSLQIRAARDAGLNVPETFFVTQSEPIGPDVPLPAILKPRFAIDVTEAGLEKGGTFYLSDKTDIAMVNTRLAGEHHSMLLQPLIRGTGEGVFGFAIQDGVIAWSGHRRLRMMNPHGSGSSACQSSIPDKETCAAINRFMANIGWSGPFMMEFLRDPSGKLWFMELNGRMWGSLALARRQGLEYPAWSVAAALDPNFEPEFETASSAKPVVLRNLGRDILHLLFVLRGPKSDFHRENWPRFWQSLCGVLKPTPLRNFYNYDPNYRLYFVRDTIWTIRKVLTR